VPPAREELFAFLEALAEEETKNPEDDAEIEFEDDSVVSGVKRLAVTWDV